VGLFIAIEGGDGSGKGTQAELLVKALADKFHKNVYKISFPRHGEASSYFVDQFLNGAYGTIDQVHPDLASLPYAVDRFAASQDIRNHLAKNDSIVISDRYIGSNLAHNGSKFPNAKERRAYYERDLHLEYDILGIPKPDLNIVLLVDTAIAQENVDKKETRAYTTLKRDIHEADPHHLEKTKAAYQELCRLFPDVFVAINCMKNGEMRPIDDIHREILKRVADRF
jgi:dTMP kinase